LKIYSHILIGCLFESMRCFWLIRECVIWFCPAVFEKYDVQPTVTVARKLVNYITTLVWYIGKLSSVIYQFSCHCDSRYVGRTSQRLQDIIKQHIPKSIRNATCSQTRIQPKHDCKSSTQMPTTQSLSSDSAIGLNLLPKPALLSIYLSEKPCSLKPQTWSCADKKNLSTISCCYHTNPLLSTSLLFSNTINIHTLICFPLYWHFLSMRVSQKALRKWIRYCQQFLNFVLPKIFSDL